MTSLQVVVNSSFHSENDSNSLLPLDGVSIPVIFFEETKSRIFANLFYHSRKTLGISWDQLNWGSHWKQFYKADTLPLSWLAPAIVRLFE